MDQKYKIQRIGMTTLELYEEKHLSLVKRFCAHKNIKADIETVPHEEFIEWFEQTVAPMLELNSFRIYKATLVRFYKLNEYPPHIVEKVDNLKHIKSDAKKEPKSRLKKVKDEWLNLIYDDLKFMKMCEKVVNGDLDVLKKKVFVARLMLEAAICCGARPNELFEMNQEENNNGHALAELRTLKAKQEHIFHGKADPIEYRYVPLAVSPYKTYEYRKLIIQVMVELRHLVSKARIYPDYFYRGVLSAFSTRIKLLKKTTPEIDYTAPHLDKH